MKLASLGLFVFELATFPFAEASRRRDWRHDAAPRVGTRAASQFLGPGEDSVSLTGLLVPGIAGDYGAIATLVAMGDEGEVYDLVTGTGQLWGGYVILGIDERRRAIIDNGQPRIIDFAVDLRRVD